MLFYEMKYECKTSFEKDDYDERKNAANNLRVNSDYLNQTIIKNGRFDIASTKEKNLTLAAAISNKNKSNLSNNALDFLSRLDIQAEEKSCEEITIENYINLIEISERNDFIFSDRDVFSSLDLERMFRFEGSSRLKEKIIDVSYSRKEAIEESERLMFVPELKPEIERIFTGTKKAFVAHPVHYIVMADDESVKDSIRQTLIGSLYNVGRLESRRICFVGSNTSDDDDGPIDADVAEELYEGQQGSTMIIQPGKSSIMGGCLDHRYEALQRVCCQIKKYRANSLSIIELSRGDEAFLERVQNELPSIRFVVLKEEMIFTAKAKKYLKRRALSDGIKDNRDLIALLPEKEEGFYPSDLKTIYEKWFDERLCVKVYPQYSIISQASKSIAKKPKGDAFQELEHLVGLERAKSVIKDSIAYHKAQKIFEQNGLKSENCARHMVFTGNPGSAKTTVARLFAQIMKDNNLLSEGNLIEAGRADIVDMYVGGTAPRVKRLFKRAAGNVLFIDEAYSLVDGHRGLYGDEAISTIVQEMENHRDDTVVIFAGYPDKMEEFLNTNPGLRSRIAFHVQFDDYSVDELCQILSVISKDNGMVLSNDVMEKVKPIFDSAITQSDFGNGRFVRNVFEHAKMKQARRIVEMDTNYLDQKVLKTLISEDFDGDMGIQAPVETRTIGFSL